MSEQNTTPFSSNQQSTQQQQLSLPLQLQAANINSNSNQIVIVNRQQEQQINYQQQQKQQQQPPQLQQQPQSQEQQQQLLEISELKSCNFVASIPTTDGRRPTLGFQIQDILPNPALPIKLFGDLYQTSSPELISASLSSNRTIQATQGRRDGTNSVPIDGLSKCFNISYKSLVVNHPILRFQDTRELVCQFPLPTPLQSLKQSLFPTKIFCISRSVSDHSDLKIEPYIRHINQLENKKLVYKYNRNLGELVEFDPQIRIDYQKQVDFGPVETTLGFKATRRINQPPPPPLSTTEVVLQQQNYMRTPYSSVSNQISPSTSSTNGFVTASTTPNNKPLSASELVMMQKHLNIQDQVLCKYCGIINSISNVKCSRCIRALDNKNIIVEKQQLTTKRDSKCIIDLASDDDKPPKKKVKQPMESNNNHSLNNSNHHNSNNDQFLVKQQNLRDSYSQENAQLIEKFNELKNSSSAEQFTTLECRSIRFGSYTTLSSSINQDKLTVLFSKIGIYFKLAHSNSGESIECAIPISEVLSCLGYLGSRLPVLFIYTGPKLGHFFANKLGVSVPTECSIENPSITLELKPPEEMDLLLIRRVFQNVYADIEYTKANGILVATSAVNKKIEENESKNKRSSSATATESRNPTTRSKKNFEANLSSVIDLNQTEISLVTIANLGITITTRDIVCLNENNFINDNIIDFYLEHLYQNVLTPEQQEKCFVYPTHFYYLLNRKKNQLDRKSDNNTSSTERKHAKVAKITKDVDIFSKDFLFIPICDGFHWYLAVICFPGLKCPHDLETCEELAEFKTLDKKTQAGYPKKIKQPIILIFDSLCEKRARALTLLRDYIQVEYSKKRSDGFVMDKDTLGGIMPKVPQQTNAIDCGLFVLEYFRYFFQDPITDYKHSIVSLEKKRWFQPLLVSNLRKVIYDTLYPLLEEKCPDRLKNIPQVKFREYVDPATVKLVIHKGKNKKSAAADTEASTSASEPKPNQDKGKTKTPLRPVIISSFSIEAGPRRSITTTTSSRVQNQQVRGLDSVESEQLIVKEAPEEQKQNEEEEEEEEELMDL